MELKIITVTERPLLKRKHIVAELHFPGEKTPSNKDVIAALAKATSASEDTVAVRSIDAMFGSTTAHLDAYVYQTKELLEKTESRPKKQREQGSRAHGSGASVEKEAAPAQGAPAPEAKK